MDSATVRLRTTSRIKHMPYPDPPIYVGNVWEWDGIEKKVVSRANSTEFEDTTGFPVYNGDPITFTEAKVVDRYIVPSDPNAPGYAPNLEGAVCFVFHTGQGSVQKEYCQLTLTLGGGQPPALDEAEGQAVVYITGGKNFVNATVNPVLVQIAPGINTVIAPTTTAVATLASTLPLNSSSVPPTVIEHLQPGDYTVQIREAKRPFCTAKTTLNIPARPEMLVTVSATAPVQDSLDTGTISILIANGYFPSNGSAQAIVYQRGTDAPITIPFTSRQSTITGLRKGDYSVTVTDASGTTVTKTVAVPAPPPTSCHLKLAEVSALAPLLGETTGGIRVRISDVTSTIDATGAHRHAVEVALFNKLSPTTSIVKYTFATTEFIHDFTNLAPGDYIVTALDLDTPSADDPCVANPVTITIPAPPPSHYSFLPWVKQRLASKAAVSPGLLRPAVPMTVQTRISSGNTGTTSEVVDSVLQLELYGPGDIVGLDPQAVLKTTPFADEQRFSPLQLASIEFKEEDLPWRYSPVAISSNGTQATPWLMLLTLEESEYELQEQSNRPLPVVRIPAGPLFPAVTNTWPWAHVQVNKQLISKPGTNKVTPSADVSEDFLNNELTQDPSLAFSRIFSPRRLKPNTRYQAFLLPAFETGRLAGLGLPIPAGTVAATRAWEGATTGADLDFPVYYQWGFQTGIAEDFESLARLMTQSAPWEAVRDELAVTLPLGSTDQARPVAQYRLIVPTILEPLSSAATVPVPAAVVTSLYEELRPGFDPQQRTAAGRPIVSAPFYGRYYAPSGQLTEPDNGEIPAGWQHELNLDPRYRVVANLGSQIIQENQEEYMQRAWAQVQNLVMVNHNLRSMQFSLRTTLSMRAKHLPFASGNSTFQAARPPASTLAGAGPEESTPEAVNTATQETITVRGMENYGLQLSALAMARTRIADSGLTVREVIRRSDVPLAVFSPAFRRIMQPFGRYQVGQAGRPLRPSQLAPELVLQNLLERDTSLQQRDQLVSLLQSGALKGADSKPTYVRAYQFEDEVVDVILKHAAPVMALHILEENTEPRVITQATTDPALQAAFSAFQGAYTTFKEPLQFLTAEQIKPPLLLNTLKDEVLVASHPAQVFTARVNETVKPTPSRQGSDWAPQDFSGADFLLDEQVPFASPPTDSITMPVGEEPQNRWVNATNLAPAALPAAAQPFPQVKPVMAYPIFQDAMGEVLRKKHPELFLPGIENFPANGISLLQINRKFIEAYLLGLNHAFGSELLWREFPTDLRGSYFQQFWDVSEFINMLPPGNLSPRQLEEDNLDVRPLAEWGNTPLAGNKQPAAPSPGTLLAIRADLLRRFPSTVICLQAAKDVSVTGVQQWVPDATDTHYPIGRMPLGQDIMALSFALTQQQITGSAPSGGSAPGGYYFIFMERPGEPQFGLDATAGSSAAPQSWNDLSWQYMAIDPGENLTVDPGQKPQVLTGVIRHVETSAHLAYALLQQPSIVAIHARDILLT